MIAVIFEVSPHPEGQEQYLELAASLKPILETMPGFISVERFQSLAEPGKLLSLSFWENEDSIMKWRNEEQHRAAQLAGRSVLFKDYRLRIATVSRDYGMHNRIEAPTDQRIFHEKKDVK